MSRETAFPVNGQLCAGAKGNMAAEAIVEAPGVRAAVRSTARLVFVDHWRAAIIILVILHHVGVVYSAITPFYYVEPKDTVTTWVLAIFLLFNQSWFMGALFLVSGYFTTGSYDHRTPGAFVLHRVTRLGIPMLLYYFVFAPISAAGIWQMPSTLTGITTPLTWQQYPQLLGIGPLWFAAMLLVFDVRLRAMAGDFRKAACTGNGCTPASRHAHDSGLRTSSCTGELPDAHRDSARHVRCGFPYAGLSAAVPGTLHHWYYCIPPRLVQDDT